MPNKTLSLLEEEEEEEEEEGAEDAFVSSRATFTPQQGQR
jgi:hypothetical protein